MVDLTEPIEVLTLNDLEAKRRAARRQLDQLTAPGRALAAAQAQLDAIEDEIAAQRATQEAQRRAAQQRQDETAALQRRYADLRSPIAFGMTELREVVMLGADVVRQLAERGITVEPIVWRLDEIARPWVEMQEKIQEAMRRPTQPATIDTIEETDQ